MKSCRIYVVHTKVLIIYRPQTHPHYEETSHSAWMEHVYTSETCKDVSGWNGNSWHCSLKLAHYTSHWWRKWRQLCEEFCWNCDWREETRNIKNITLHNGNLFIINPIQTALGWNTSLQSRRTSTNNSSFSHLFVSERTFYFIIRHS